MDELEVLLPDPQTSRVGLCRFKIDGEYLRFITGICAEICVSLAVEGPKLEYLSRAPALGESEDEDLSCRVVLPSI